MTAAFSKVQSLTQILISHCGRTKGGLHVDFSFRVLASAAFIVARGIGMARAADTMLFGTVAFNLLLLAPIDFPMTSTPDSVAIDDDFTSLKSLLYLWPDRKLTGAVFCWAHGADEIPEITGL